MYKLIISVLILCTSFVCNAQEKMWYYKKIDNSKGVFGKYTKEFAETLAASVCEATEPYHDTRVLKLNTDGTIKCPVEVDSTKQATLDQEAALNALIAKSKANRVFGSTMIDLIGALNLKNNLTVAQQKTMKTTFATIEDLLESGLLESAKVDIEAITPDGTIVKAEDKAYILNKITAYLAQ
jgi:hypothetical protein